MSWTILTLLNWTTDYFKKADIASARLDAEVLLAYTLQLKRLDLYLQFERSLSSEELAKFKTLIKRRMDHEPVAYLIGEKEFWSRSFNVGPGVLIPRPETELIIETSLKISGIQTGAIKILDIGTGSGILAITLAKEMIHSQVTAIDISPEALAYAKTNADRHGVSDRVKFLEQDFLASPDSPASSPYDLIVSNPPYIASAEIDTLDDDVKKFEPRMALDGDGDGLKFYRALSEKAASQLSPNGHLIMEIGEDQGAAVVELFSKAPWQSTQVVKDYAGHDRVIIVSS